MVIGLTPKEGRDPYQLWVRQLRRRCRRIDRSPFGKALRAIRDNETRAEFIGIPVRRYRWYAFIISAIFTGLAGGLYGQMDRQVTPEQLYWLWSAKLVLATVLGGMRQFWGPVLGGFAFVPLQDLALRFVEYRSVVLGVLLIILVFAFPGGIAGGAALLADKMRKLPNRQGRESP